MRLTTFMQQLRAAVELTESDLLRVFCMLGFSGEETLEDRSQERAGSYGRLDDPQLRQIRARPVVAQVEDQIDNPALLNISLYSTRAVPHSWLDLGRGASRTIW
jgi:hypothetical protein